VITGISFLVSVAHCVFGIPGLPSLHGHTLMGSGLSLLLVFRTNTANQRFHEGRKIWNDILDHCRDIAMSISLFQADAGPKRIRIVRTSLQAFPFVMQEHVRSWESPAMKGRRQALLQEIELAKYDMDHIEKKKSCHTRNKPLHITARLMKVIGSIANSEDDRFTNRERVWLLSMVNKLSHTVGRCERLVQTPVPLSYARHTSRFLSIWCLTLPLAMVGTYRWLTAPVVFLIAWALFGIQEIGHSIEDPFLRQIELTPICEAIYHDCARALPGKSASQEKLEKRIRANSTDSEGEMQMKVMKSISTLHTSATTAK